MIAADFAHRIAVDWPRTLEQVLALGASAGKDGLFVFDLDSTVFDNTPRQARILREFGAAKKVPALEGCQAFHFTNGWELGAAALACGVPAPEVKALERELKRFWGSRFFTSDYCADDVEIVGAPRFLHACVNTGAQVAYVTGRYERMRPGTLAALFRCGLPVPGGAVSLLMKPALRDSDEDFKRQLHPRLAKLGRVLAVFDNEPLHANDYARGFPDAIVVHLATDHSGRELKLEPRIVSIPHFAW